jgi:RNA-binding protein YhbY
MTAFNDKSLALYHSIVDTSLSERVDVRGKTIVYYHSSYLSRARALLASPACSLPFPHDSIRISE